MGLAELIEALIVANIKLYMVKDKQAEASATPHLCTAERMKALVDQDLELCKRRAQLRTEINKLLGSQGDSVKIYGAGS